MTLLQNFQGNVQSCSTEINFEGILDDVVVIEIHLGQVNNHLDKIFHIFFGKFIFDVDNCKGIHGEVE